jgi:hypothetical protein
LASTSPTSGSRSVGIVRWLIKATALFYDCDIFMDFVVALYCEPNRPSASRRRFVFTELLYLTACDNSWQVSPLHSQETFRNIFPRILIS